MSSVEALSLEDLSVPALSCGLLAEWSLGAVEGRQEAEGSWCLPSVFGLRYESSANFGYVSSGSFPGR